MLLGELGVRVLVWKTQIKDQFDADQDEAEYNRLYAKFKKAMMAAKKYEWSQERCVTVGKQIEAEIAEKSIDDADQAGLAVSMVTDGVKADMLLDKQKKWKMRRIFHVMQQQEGLGQAGDAVATWVTHLNEHIKAEYDKLYRKFTKALLLAKKYEWSDEECVAVGIEIEAEIAEKNTVEADQAAVAVDRVMQEIKAQKLLQKQKDWKMKRIFHIMQKKKGVAEICDAVATWASRMRS